MFLDFDEEGNMYTSNLDRTVRVFSKDGEQKSVFSWPSQSTYQFPPVMLPAGIAVYKDRIYLADFEGNKIVVIDKQGKIIETFGERGSGPKQFDSPIGLKISNGRLYVVDSKNHRVQVLGLRGEFIMEVGVFGPSEAILFKPTDLSVGQDGRLYIVDKMNMIKCYSADGEYHSRQSATPGIYGIYAGSEGVFLSNNYFRSILIRGYDGAELGRFGGSKPTLEQDQADNTGETLMQGALSGLAVREGKLYIAEPANSRVGIIDLATVNGSPRKAAPALPSVYWLKDHLLTAKRVVYGPGGMLIGIDEKTNSIVAQDGATTLWRWSAEGALPSALAMGPKPSLWVADSGRARVVELDATTGSVLQEFGEKGDKEGMLGYPKDIAVDAKGTVYVLDAEYSRIAAFSSNGKPKGSMGRGGVKDILKSPIAIDMDDKGLVYVLDEKRKTVTLFNSMGFSVSEFGKRGKLDNELHSPMDIATNGEAVLVLDDNKHRVKAFQRSGQFLFAFGLEGNEPVDFSAPAAIYLYENSRLLVSDPARGRVQEFAFLVAPSPVKSAQASRAATFDKIELKWAAPERGTASEYRVYRWRKEQGGYVQIASTRETSFADNSVKPDAAYAYYVTALDSWGMESAGSDIMLIEKATR